MDTAAGNGGRVTDESDQAFDPLDLEPLGRIVDFQEGDVLRRPGDECDRVVVVLEGSVRVEQAAADGRSIELYQVTRSEPCVLEVSSALSGRAYPVRAVAQTPGRALAVSSHRFADALGQSGPLQQHVFSLISERLLEVIALVEAVTFRHVDARLARLLLRDADQSGVVHATHAELAERLGSAREVVSRLLERLEDDGAVRLQRGSVKVLEPERLRVM